MLKKTCSSQHKASFHGENNQLESGRVVHYQARVGKFYIANKFCNQICTTIQLHFTGVLDFKTNLLHQRRLLANIGSKLISKNMRKVY